MPTGSKQDKYDVVVVGGGHNGLVAAVYLARAGLTVLVLERLDEVGGAAASTQAFAGLPTRISRYSSVVGLLPERICQELELDVQLRERRISTYAPLIRDRRYTGLLIEQDEGDATRRSFRDLTGSDHEFEAWCSFRDEIRDFADVVGPTLMEPLPYGRDLRDLAKRETWEMLVEQPLGQAVESRFADDAVRGIAAGDALVGGLADLHDESLVQNRQFLHHALGLGTSRWQVPVGGMGAVAGALERAAWRHGAEVVTRAFVDTVESDGDTASVTWQADGERHTVEAGWVLCGVAPWVLQILLGEAPGPRPEGAHVRINMLLERLPRLRSGASPARAFNGAFQVAAGYQTLRDAYAQATLGQVPTLVPGVLHCHTLSDPSILGPLSIQGLHSLSFVGTQTPARLFTGNVAEVRDEVVERVLDAVNIHLEEPLESLLALDANQVPCLEALAPQDLEAALALPGGHPFHGELDWPWAGRHAAMDTPAQRWGVATPLANVVLCGSGAQRGGSVSGIGGHNAAMAVLDTRAGRL